jgi:hypothetical protein
VAAWAQPPTPSTDRELKIPLVATDRGGKAAGMARIQPRSLLVELTGLQPGGVYTVWVVSDRPREERGLGPRPHSFTADAQGNGSYRAPFSVDDRTKWSLVEIFFVPGGNPNEERDRKVILYGALGNRRY